MQADPLHEAAHRDLIRLYAVTGQTLLALQQYRTLEEGLVRELAVAPDPETQALIEALRGLKTRSDGWEMAVPLPEGRPDRYGAAMREAQQAYEDNHVALTLQLLEPYREFSGRGFEWFYWQRLCHRERLCLPGLMGLYAVSPDGRQALSVQESSGILLWDIQTGQALRTFPEATAAAFAPDGLRVATASAATSCVTLWGHPSECPDLILMGLSDGVNTIAFAPDGQRIAAGSGEIFKGEAGKSEIRVWNARTGQPLMSLPGHGAWVSAATYSPNGDLLATCGEDRQARLSDARTGQPVRILEGHTEPVFNLVFAPGGRELVTVSFDRTARIWDTQTGRCLRILVGHQMWVYHAAYSPDGRLIATASRDRTVRLWQAATGKSLATMQGHTGEVSHVAFALGGRCLVTASSYDTRVWDRAAFQEPRILRGHRGGIWSAAFSPDGRRIVTGSGDNTARLWDTRSGRLLQTIPGPGQCIWSVAFMPGGQAILIGDDRAGHLIDLVTTRSCRTLAGSQRDVGSIAVSPNGRLILTASNLQPATLLWEAQTGTLLRTLPEAGCRAAFSPDGTLIATNGPDRTVILWETATGRLCQRLPGAHGGVAFSPDSRWLVTSNAHTAPPEGVAQVWHCRTGRRILCCQVHADWIPSVAFSPDGQRILTGSLDGTARLWDAHTGQPLLTLKGHAASIVDAQFAPNGRAIVTVSNDWTGRIWTAAPEE